MSDEIIDQQRRQFLVTTASVMGAVGAGVAATPFISALSPSAKTAAAVAPVEVDISDLAIGEIRREQWRGQPIWVLRRTQEELDRLPRLDNQLLDPKSTESEQPDAARNAYRSLEPGVFVAVGLCTHLGCSPLYRPEIDGEELGEDWQGGFFCPCHGSKFDLAGRVYKGVPAPRNLVIPPYHFVDATHVIIGTEESQETT